MRLDRDEPEEEVLNLTPLIDMMFLLLVFFLAATTFDESRSSPGMSFSSRTTTTYGMPCARSWSSTATVSTRLATALGAWSSRWRPSRKSRSSTSGFPAWTATRSVGTFEPRSGAGWFSWL